MQKQIEKVIDGITYIGNPEHLFCKGCVGDKHDYLCDRLCEGIRCRHNWSKKPVEHPIKLGEKIEGVKFDQDKIKYSLLPSYALEAAAKNMTDGLKKYPERDNWRKVDNAQERYLDALYRHLEAHRRGDVYDTESSDPTNTHLAAVVVNAMFLLEFLLNPELNKGENK